MGKISAEDLNFIEGLLPGLAWNSRTVSRVCPDRSIQSSSLIPGIPLPLIGGNHLRNRDLDQGVPYSGELLFSGAMGSDSREQPEAKMV
jgi:hypothetical protein